LGESLDWAEAVSGAPWPDSGWAKTNLSTMTVNTSLSQEGHDQRVLPHLVAIPNRHPDHGVSSERNIASMIVAIVEECHEDGHMAPQGVSGDGIGGWGDNRGRGAHLG
jgi:hypothetical protein